MSSEDAPVEAGTTSLFDAVVLMSSGLDLGTALDRLIKASCALTGAQYGLIGIVDDDGGITDFVLHGISDEVRERIPVMPTWHGLLGVLLEDPRPMRLADISTHPRAIGLPPGHPPMSTFLGVPVVVDGTVFGNLYLTEKAGGGEFTAEDESNVETLAQIAGLVIGNARAHGISERRYRWLESSIAMSHELQGFTETTPALGQVAARLCAVAEAAYVVVVEHLDEEPTLVAADSGAGDVSAADLTSVIDLAAPVLDKAAVLAEVMVLPHRGGSVFVVPLPSRLVPGHSLLVVLAERTVSPVSAVDADVLHAFADQAALALDRAQGLLERQEHMLVADRDRIARDLHDIVIQRIFAIALQLQGVRRSVILDAVRDRLDDAIADLSTTIREVRSTIFELRHEGASLKSEIRGLARDYVPVLGFAPFVRIRGAVDAHVAPAVADHLVATMREALSNVARHSDADACVVEVEVDQAQLLLRVADNGRGIGTRVVESGLSNMRGRALELGGTFRIRPDEPQGTVLEWRVPLAG